MLFNRQLAGGLAIFFSGPSRLFESGPCGAAVMRISLFKLCRVLEQFTSPAKGAFQ